jgi:hypothetical protein
LNASDYTREAVSGKTVKEKGTPVIQGVPENLHRRGGF